MKEIKEEQESLNFIENIIEQDLKEGKVENLITRFPPEPNGYLHIGHAKSICLNFGIAEKYNTKCNLRFDDTNPEKESDEYVNSIVEDVKWLGFNWDGDVRYTSDYFDKLYSWAIKLIKNGKAYIDEQTSKQMAEQKGTPTQAGKNSPFRDRPIEENLELFEKMKNGEYKEGEKVLRAKIDMSHTNMLLRDPVIYRVLNKSHHRTGNKWNVYPMYDFAHGQSDYIEGISHSICTLEFDPHRALYDWLLENIYEGGQRPHQYEFSRLNLSYTIMSKRKLMELVENNYVEGWDDPRMPTISGLRRRGYTPKSIREFCKRIGVSKRENVIDVGLLEETLREDLNQTSNRVMAVLNPVKLVIENYPEDKQEILISENNPNNEEAGSREIIFSKEIYIEREDFMEDAPRKFFRLTLGKEVRLKNAYIIKGKSVEKDEQGNITTVYCTYDLDSKSGSGSEASKRKVKGTIHWVDSKNSVDADIKIYDRLFFDENPDGYKDKNFSDFINENSLEVKKNCKLEKSLENSKQGEKYQFQRLGYFTLDKNSTKENITFIRTVSLKDSWKKKKK